MHNITCNLSKTQIMFLLFGMIILGFPLGVSPDIFLTSPNKLFAQTKEENTMTIAAKAQITESKPSVQELIKAVKNLNTTLVKSLIEKGVNLNGRDENEMTPLIHAAHNYQKDAAILKLLLKNGADVNARGKAGVTALMAAMGPGGSREGINALLEYNADVNISTADGETPLMWAVSLGWWDVEIVKSLLE
jgi:hypothetical protein